MNRVWKIPELVDTIAIHLDLSSLTSVARTNRLLWNVSIALLWETITTDALACLIRALELERQYSVQYSPTALDRFAHHAQYVRSLCIPHGIRPTVRRTLQRILDQAGKGNLRVWFRIASIQVPEGEESNGLYPYWIDAQAELFRACLSPSVRQVIISIGTNALRYLNYLTTLLEGIIGRCPAVDLLQAQRQFIGSGVQRLSVEFKDALLRISAKGYLRSVRTFVMDLWALAPEVLQALARLHQLEALHIKVVPGNILFKENIYLRILRDLSTDSFRAMSDDAFPANSFLALRTLDVDLPSNILKRLLSVTPGIGTLRVCFPRCEGSLSLQAISPPLRLQSLSLNFANLHYALTENPDSLLLPFAVCKEIRYLSLDLPFVHAFWDKDLERIGVMWPCLQRLRLTGLCAPITVSYTVRGIHSLLRRCPDLDDLDLYMPIAQEVISQMSDEIVVLRPLIIRPLGSLTDTDERTAVSSSAARLYVLCPNVRILPDRVSDWEGVMEHLQLLQLGV
ncbi:hypothetical protein DACRYDRAFT_105019 [Dacryopinax primogenitus]|uniref:Uncharacterized protein n=1 Tax=Dacryopinax primogenitus (strain DJM 731) TaxID=1858805 RepID=M5G9Y4_DACPD|nr:uncharacterized protein DACRYDRAFT_105019 [Dacryopinax primogenitus]EJU05135.1 hypothetical protein DACRYDRAFT_105019 [Dacryopinax primogenitus]